MTWNRCLSMADMGTTRLVQVTSAAPAGHWRLHLTFTDGFEGTADLSELEGKGVFQPLSDPEYFDQARVDQELGTVVWPNSADIAPETLREWAARDTPRQSVHWVRAYHRRSSVGVKASSGLATAIIKMLRRARF